RAVLRLQNRPGHDDQLFLVLQGLVGEDGIEHLAVSVNDQIVYFAHRLPVRIPDRHAQDVSSAECRRRRGRRDRPGNRLAGAWTWLACAQQSQRASQNRRKATSRQHYPGGFHVPVSSSLSPLTVVATDLVAAATRRAKA